MPDLGDDPVGAEPRTVAAAEKHNPATQVRGAFLCPFSAYIVTAPYPDVLSINATKDGVFWYVLAALSPHRRDLL